MKLANNVSMTTSAVVNRCCSDTEYLAMSQNPKPKDGKVIIWGGRHMHA